MARTQTRGAGQGSPEAAWDDEVEHLYGAWHRLAAAAEAGHRLMADRTRRRYLFLGDPGGGPIDDRRDRCLRLPPEGRRPDPRSRGRPRGTASRYETLRRDMARVPALPPKARTEPVREMESVRRRMDRYAKESPTIGGWQWGKLERQFHLSKVPQTRPGRDAPSASPGRRGLCRPATRLGRGEIGETLI